MHPRDDGDRDALERHVLRWCCENHIPFHDVSKDEIHVVFYEDLVRDAEAEVSRLFRYLGMTFEHEALTRLSKPSPTAFTTQRRASPTREEEARATTILAAFGLFDRVYEADRYVPAVRAD